MREQSFCDWLHVELQTAKAALIGLYEWRDELLYEKAPALRKRYMDSIGKEEDAVLKAELETALLRRKAEMMQIAVNRREPIDLEKIEMALEEEREAMIAALENGDRTLEEVPELNDEQRNELRKLYREITESFHPAVHKDLTRTQRELYDKAVYAYKMQDIQGMKVIYELLFQYDGISIELNFDIARESIEAGNFSMEWGNAYAEMAKELSVDYRLAEQVFPAFAPLEEDEIVLANLRDCMEKKQAVQQEIEAIRSAFPFSAAATLYDPQKTDEYLVQLKVRAMNCCMEKAQLEKNIQRLMEAASHG